MKLGFIGLGITDMPMVISLARAGHQPHVTVIGPVADELLSLGAVSVETAHQVTDASDIISITVSNTPQVEDILLGENDCTRASSKGKTTVDISSVSPIETKHFARWVNGLSGDYLDAPVSDDEIGVREGVLLIVVDGDEAVFEHVKSLSELFGKGITLVGSSGDGQTCKVANQIIVALNIKVVLGALLFTLKAGANPARVRQALMGGPASSRIPEVHGEYTIKHTFNPDFKTTLHRKDLNLVLQSAKALALNLSNTTTYQGLFNICATNGGSQLDHSALVQALELMTDHKLAWYP